MRSSYYSAISSYQSRPDTASRFNPNYHYYRAISTQAPPAADILRQANQQSRQPFSVSINIPATARDPRAIRLGLSGSTLNNLYQGLDQGLQSAGLTLDQADYQGIRQEIANEVNRAIQNNQMTAAEEQTFLAPPTADHIISQATGRISLRYFDNQNDDQANLEVHADDAQEADRKLTRLLQTGNISAVEEAALRAQLNLAAANIQQTQTQPRRGSSPIFAPPPSAPPRATNALNVAYTATVRFQPNFTNVVARNITLRGGTINNMLMDLDQQLEGVNLLQAELNQLRREVRDQVYNDLDLGVISAHDAAFFNAPPEAEKEVDLTTGEIKVHYYQNMYDNKPKITVASDSVLNLKARLDGMLARRSLSLDIYNALVQKL